HRGAGARKGTGITPTFPGTVEPAGAGELPDDLLDIGPDVAGVTVAGVEDDRWASFARAEDVETTTADVYRAAHLWKALSITPLSDLFVDRADGDCEEHRS